MSENKIFEEYKVDCNNCESYWTDQCDGVSCSSKDGKRCTAYRAIRRVNIPEQIDKLKRNFDRIEKFTMFMTILFMLHLLCHLIW